MVAKKKEKINLELLVLCDYAIVSKENKLSIVGIFDQIFTEKVPSQHPKMFVVGVLKGESDKSYAVTLRIKDPSGKEILPSQDLKNNFGPNGSSNIIAEFGNMPFPLAGKYTVELLVQGRQLGIREFTVFLTGEVKNGRKEARRYSN